ncbi:siderophore-interacting protein [Gordonia insulae]|uniref:Vibriobactin utilization protein ViuB n=1 Tax=Gordonia insulae TaxID=2420509 RepID=A0A3G8JU96_9ACTN|nr:siderophore-interacting protein [Gordonia insulae]AZG47740.1 Vibriobactin utilization protein ViuB [Gordonia insulae]
MGYSTARVSDAADLNPRLRRIRFDVPGLEQLRLPDGADEAVGIYFPRDGETSPPPMTLRDGVWAYHDVDPVPPGRSYSVRAVDHESRSMTVDFVVHSRGPATMWAQGARPGDEVGMSHARGWYGPPPTADWHLLVADLAGLPALARILDEHNSPASVIAVVEVAADDDVAYLSNRVGSTGTRIIPHVGTGNGLAPSVLGTAVRRLTLPEGQGYCWFAGEAAQSRDVRKYLRNDRGWQRDRYDIIGYWRAEGENWARRYAEHGDELFAVYQRAISAGKSEKAAAEEFDEALERAGL